MRRSVEELRFHIDTDLLKWHRSQCTRPYPTRFTASSDICLELTLVMASFLACWLLSSTFLGTLRKWEVVLVYIPSPCQSYLMSVVIG